MISRVSLSLSEALDVIAAAQSRAEELEMRCAVAVVDTGGQLVALQSMDGTQGAGADVAIAKARAAVLFQRSTASFEVVSAALDKPAVLLLTSAVPHALPVAGGLPVLVQGGEHSLVAGAVGVSGGNGEQDVSIAEHGLRALAYEEGRPLLVGSTAPA